MAKVDVSSVPDRVYAILRERILAGDLEPQSRLHQEGISAELGVSRTPVREAIARLAAEGLVELLANRGARVAAIGEKDLEAAQGGALGVVPLGATLGGARGGGGAPPRARGRPPPAAAGAGVARREGRPLLHEGARKRPTRP